MMNTNKKLFRQSVVSLLALLLLTSCGGKDTADGNTPTDTHTDTGTETAAADAANGRPALGLPDMDFGGVPYRISCFQESDQNSLYTDSLDGEAVNDAIYTRNQDLMDTYNFTIEVKNTDNYQNQTKEISTLVLAGDDAFELVCGHVVTTCNNAISGIYMDLYEVPYLDFTKPWWPAQSVEQMTVYDRMYTICSGINYRQLASSKVIFFNKDLLAANDLEMPYQWVLDGTWTMDKLISQSKGLYQDLNGDGKKDMEDLYGFSTFYSQNGFLISCDAQVLSPTDDGGREITVMSDKMVSLVETLYNWYYESGDVYPATYESDKADFLPNLFMANRAVYAFGHLYHAVDYYRDSDVSYGVAPMPKYDEKQDSYYVFACPSLFSIPVSCQNPEFAGFVFEAMTYYGYYDIIPVYYEMTLQGKIADSQDDVTMLEIINDHLTVSFAYCYDNWEGFAHLLGSRMNFTQKSGSKDMASMYEKYLPSAQKRLDKVLEGFIGE